MTYIFYIVVTSITGSTQGPVGLLASGIHGCKFKGVFSDLILELYTTKNFVTRFVSALMKTLVQVKFSRTRRQVVACTKVKRNPYGPKRTVTWNIVTGHGFVTTGHFWAREPDMGFVLMDSNCEGHRTTVLTLPQPISGKAIGDWFCKPIMMVRFFSNQMQRKPMRVSFSRIIANTQLFPNVNRRSRSGRAQTLNSCLTLREIIKLWIYWLRFISTEPWCDKSDLASLEWNNYWRNDNHIFGSCIRVVILQLLCRVLCKIWETI